MGTKSTIQTLINTNLADASDILASEHRAVEHALLNELYADIVNERYSLSPIQSITAETIDDNFYNVFFTKQGRVVNIIGRLTNKQSSITTNTSFFSIINSDYLPNEDIILFNKMIGTSTIDNRNLKLSFNLSNELICESPLGVGESIDINITYFTEN